MRKKIIKKLSPLFVVLTEGDEWKVAFTTLEGSFEPMVMFFWVDKLSSNVSSYDE